MGVWTFLVPLEIQGDHEDVSWWTLYSTVAIETTTSRFTFLTSGSGVTRRTVVAAFTRRSSIVKATTVGVGFTFFRIRCFLTFREGFVVGLRRVCRDTQRTLPLLEGRTGLCERVVRLRYQLVARRHEILTDPVSSFRIWNQHQLLHIARVEAFIEELLADENDASIAQPLILSKKRPRYGLSTIFNQSDSVALHADAQTMPLSIVDGHLKFGLDGGTPRQFTFEVVEDDRFTDGNNQLLVTVIVVNGKEHRIDALGRS